MKKVTVVFLKLFLFVSLVFAGDGAYVFEPGTYYMMDTNVNIRSEPNTHSQKLGKLQPGDKIEVLEQAAGSIYSPIIIDNFPGYWYKIRFGEITGYVFSKYIAVNTYQLENIPGAYLFFRYSDSSHHFYSFNINEDFLFFRNGQFKNFPIIEKNSNSKMALWKPAVYYSSNFNPDITLIGVVNSYIEYGQLLLFCLDKFEKIHYLDAIPLGDKNHLSEGIQYRLTLEPENCFKITVLLDTEPFRIYNCTLNGTDNLTVKFFDRDKFISNYKSFSVVNEYLKEEYLSVNNEEYKVYSKDGVKLEGLVFKNDFFLTEISCTNPSIDFGEGIKVGCLKKVIEDLLCSPDNKGDNCYIYRTEAETLIIYFDKETEVVSKIVFSANI